MAAKLYKTKSWQDLRTRVLSHDANCALANLAGDCRGVLVVHHIQPVASGGPEIPNEDGVAVLCARHHRVVHGWLAKQGDGWRRCPHKHRTAESRRLCEERLNRGRFSAAA